MRSSGLSLARPAGIAPPPRECSPLKNATRHSAGLRLINVHGVGLDAAGGMPGRASRRATARHHAYPEVELLGKVDRGYPQTMQEWR